jgi:DNA-binding GntR family transcriptional regulator
MKKINTREIVEALTSAIVEHRLAPGEKLVEQRLADQFQVSRTLIRQALYQLSEKYLIILQPSRGAKVASPSVAEAKQVFSVRRMLESGMVRAFISSATPEHIQALKMHILQEKAAVNSNNIHNRTELLGDFHVCMAQLMGNTVLAQLLSDLIARCTLVTLMYQSSAAAQHSSEEHTAILDAIEQRNVALALERMDAHLCNVEKSLAFTPDSHS